MYKTQCLEYRNIVKQNEYCRIPRISVCCMLRSSEYEYRAKRQYSAVRKQLYLLFGSSFVVIISNTLDIDILIYIINGASKIALPTLRFSGNVTGFFYNIKQLLSEHITFIYIIDTY